MMTATFLLLVFISTTTSLQYDKHSLSDTAKTGAVCLDGSTPAYYLAPSSTGSNSNKWMIYFEPGGFCVGDQDFIPDVTSDKSANCFFFPCVARTAPGPFQVFGSSNNYPESIQYEEMPFPSPFLTPDCNDNPTFCDWNKVWVRYCDGGLFSGDRDDPVPIFADPADETTFLFNIYYRGHSILTETLKDLLQNEGLDSATDVVIGGSSAGGLSTLYNLDYISHYIKKNNNHKNPNYVTVAGFVESAVFLPEVGDDDTDSTVMMQWIIDNQQIVVHNECKDEVENGNIDSLLLCSSWETALDFIKTPLFIHQSKYDQFAAMCHLELTDSVVNIDADSVAVAAINDFGQDIDDAFVDVFNSLTERQKHDDKLNYFLFMESCDHHSVLQREGEEADFLLYFGAKEAFEYWNVKIKNEDGIKYNGVEAFDFWYNENELKDTFILDQRSTNGAYPCHECCAATYEEPL